MKSDSDSSFVPTFFKAFVAFWVCCFPLQNASADLLGSSGYRYVYTQDDPVIGEAQALVGFQKSKNGMHSAQKRVEASKSILTLGDGFEKRDYKLAESLQKMASKKTDIYKSGIDAPKDFHMDPNLKDNLAILKIDHQKPMSFFEDDEVDTVLLRKGLCHCQGHTTCGGLRMGQVCSGCGHTDANTLFHSVARILNKKNPKTIAYLHGVHFGQFCHYQEIETQNRFEEVLKTVEKAYPALEGKMLYIAEPIDTTHYTWENAPQVSGVKLKDAVPVFIGVQFTVRPETLSKSAH